MKLSIGFFAIFLALYFTLLLRNTVINMVEKTLLVKMCEAISMLPVSAFFVYSLLFDCKNVEDEGHEAVSICSIVLLSSQS